MPNIARSLIPPTLKRMDQRVVKRAMGGRVSEHDAINLQRGREELIAALADELKGARVGVARDAR